MCVHCGCVGMCPCLLVPTEADWFLGLEVQVVVLGTELKSAKVICALNC